MLVSLLSEMATEDTALTASPLETTLKALRTQQLLNERLQWQLPSTNRYH